MWGGATPPKVGTPCSNLSELKIVKLMSEIDHEEAVMQQTEKTIESKPEKKDIVVGAINLVAALMAKVY